MRKLELLSPAGNAEIAIQAIKHGADAVYIGPPSHGARKSASNSLEDIKRVVDYAHKFGAKVYVTVNTLIYDNELKVVENMIRALYQIGVDALIIQDMGILRMDIPPIALHASTQCDIRTPEKARFLEEVGFSQLVLARELSLAEICAITRVVSVPVEVFVHGALCVSYSGRCGAGYVCSGRSGNRGECPQVCRQAFTLCDADGKVLAKDRYLLSLKDYRADCHLDELVKAGVSSFKIEGRLKEEGYVKNVTAYYSRLLDALVEKSGNEYRRSSYGESELRFHPALEKSFNRGFTDYGLGASRTGWASIQTPKSLGEPIHDIRQLRPGDGISYFDSKGDYCGVQVNGISGNRIIGNRPFTLPKGAQIRRTSSIEWKKLMASETAERKLWIDVEMDAKGIIATEETGAKVRIPIGVEGEKAVKTTEYRRVFEKLGGTPFRLRSFSNNASGLFFPVSLVTSLRRKLVDSIISAKKAIYIYEYRKKENLEFPYTSANLDYRDNVANVLAERFYRDHGVKGIEPALEVSGRSKAKGKVVMSMRHCILRELGLCLKGKPNIKLPLSFESGSLRFTPEFDCGSCEMHLRNS